MRNAVHLFGIALVVAVAGVSGAQSSSDLARENADLQKRIDKLDKELEDIKKSVAQQTGMEDGAGPKVVWSNLDIQLYGYLKLDAAYDSSRIDNGNYAKWVEQESANSNDDQFNMTANETRLGMLINGPNSGGMKTSGRVEVDFYGGGAAENKAHLMMRHAYLKLDWPEERFSIIAGQTSDVISPLLPSTVNYSVCWWVGNIGYRRPQIRFTKEVSRGEDVDWKFEGAFTRMIGRDDAVTGGTESGEDAGFPSVQGRVSVTLPLYGPKRSTIGLSGHRGKEEYDIDSTGRNKKFTSWSVNADLTQPIRSWLAIKGEVFTGENLDAYLGGIGQGVITDTTKPNYYEEIRSSGGWIAASLGPWGKMRFNTGISMDEVDRGNVNTGDRTVNRSVFGNMFYSVNKQTEVAFELSHWNTDYKGPGDAESVRAQLALIYKF